VSLAILERPLLAGSRTHHQSLLGIAYAPKHRDKMNVGEGVGAGYRIILYCVWMYCGVSMEEISTAQITYSYSKVQVEVSACIPPNCEGPKEENDVARDKSERHHPNFDSLSLVRSLQLSCPRPYSVFLVWCFMFHASCFMLHASRFALLLATAYILQPAHSR